jgi:hypothetical protein
MSSASSELGLSSFGARSSAARWESTSLATVIAPSRRDRSGNEIRCLECRGTLLVCRRPSRQRPAPASPSREAEEEVALPVVWRRPVAHQEQSSTPAAGVAA